MILTGKCKEDFVKWLTSGSSSMYWTRFPNVTKGDFYNLPTSMQFGVLQDFADSKSLDLYIKPRGSKKSVYLDFCGSHLITEYLDFDTLQEARTAAIVKFNELYNEGFKR